jgi:hypothetical protein
MRGIQEEGRRYTCGAGNVVTQEGRGVTMAMYSRENYWLNV